jgi:hypothetical protein
MKSNLGETLPSTKRFIPVDVQKIPKEVWQDKPILWKELWKWYQIIEKEEDWLSNEVEYSHSAKDYYVVKRNIDCYYQLAIKTIPFYFAREDKNIGVRIAGKDIPKYWEEPEVVKNHVYWMIDLESLNEWFKESFSKRKKAKMIEAEEIL